LKRLVGTDSGFDPLQRHAGALCRFPHRLQTLLSDTWAHAIDDVSSDSYFAIVPAADLAASQERGSSDSDIRQTFSGALSHSIPAPGSGIWRTILGNWSTDSTIYARTGLSVNVVTGNDPWPAGVQFGAFGAERPDLISGVPLWIADPNVAGGRNQSGGIQYSEWRGAGELGPKCARRIRRYEYRFDAAEEFRLHERLTLQVRADPFNIFNQRNFGPPTNDLSSPLFGQSTQMRGASLGSGGQNARSCSIQSCAAGGRSVHLS
jgi:hypothetical protein